MAVLTTFDEGGDGGKALAADGRELVVLAVPPRVVDLLRGPAGGPLARLLGLGSRSEVVTAALRAAAVEDAESRR